MIETGVGLRGRVERLLQGNAREQDLTALFFALREESGGKGLVSEIAHFIAHPDVRTQGLVTRDVRDLCAFLRFIMPLDRGLLVRTSLPSNTPDALRANLRRTRSSHLRAAGFKPRQAEDMLEKIIAKISVNGVIRQPIRLNEEENRLFMTISSIVKGGPFFTGSDAVKDLRQILRRKGILRQDEVAKFNHIEKNISLFILCILHGKKIDLEDGSFAEICIADSDQQTLGAYAFFDVAINIINTQRVGGWVFGTDLKTAKYCEPDVAPKSRSAFVGEFEISAQGQLARVR